MKITVALLAIAGALDLVVWWAATGAHWFGLDKIPVITSKRDDFGDLTTTTEWVEKFVPGLFDFAGPGASVLMAIAVGLLWLSRKDLVYSR